LIFDDFFEEMKLAWPLRAYISNILMSPGAALVKLREEIPIST
jgi:hypothetical protein